MNNLHTNVGKLYENELDSEPMKVAATTFMVEKNLDITMTKTTDKINEYYYVNDPITFTITLKNNGSENISGLFFKDIIDPIVKPIDGDDYDVSTTSGTITSKKNNVNINDITLLSRGIVVITIKGVIG